MIKIYKLKSMGWLELRRLTIHMICKALVIRGSQLKIALAQIGPGRQGNHQPSMPSRLHLQLRASQLRVWSAQNEIPCHLIQYAESKKCHLENIHTNKRAPGGVSPKKMYHVHFDQQTYLIVSLWVPRLVCTTGHGVPPGPPVSPSSPMLNSKS